MKLKRFLGAIVIVLAFLATPRILIPSASAQYVSPSYRIEETFVGSGGELDPSSPNYKAQQSAGDLANGFVSGTLYKAYSGFLTPNEPFLEMVVSTTAVNLGTLSASTTATGTASFHVRAYINSSYSVVSMANPPTSESGHILTGLSSPTASSAGTEQFGINLMANTAPTTFGADPVWNPNNTFANGIAATGYNTANQYKYVAGNTIAQSNGNGWGETDFTIAYIANINPVSPAGSYVMHHDLVVVATY